MLDIKALRGVIPPLVTPVDRDENIDAPALRRLIDYVIGGGVHGVFVLGSNGEFYGLSFENQRRAVETTVEQTNGRVPVYAGASAITTRECVKLAKMAEDAGADALTVLTPMFITPNENELYEHFKTVASATRLPVILYNNPGKTNNNISAGLLARLAALDNVFGVKNTSFDFVQTVEYIRLTKDTENFRVLSGSDYLIYATLAYGGYGCVAGCANVAPRLVSDIYEKYQAGDLAGAMQAQYKLIPLRNVYNYGTFPVAMKDCLNLMGLDAGDPIKPVSHSSDEKLAEMKKVLEDLGLL